MAEERKEILRVQFDGRSGLWKIVKKTYGGSGGWGRFQQFGYFLHEDADNRLNEIVSNQPELYEKEAK